MSVCLLRVQTIIDHSLKACVAKCTMFSSLGAITGQIGTDGKIELVLFVLFLMVKLFRFMIPVVYVHISKD